MDGEDAPVRPHPLSPISRSVHGRPVRLPLRRDADSRPRHASRSGSSLEHVDDDELDPGSFDLVMPGEAGEAGPGKHALEQRAELLFSRSHMQAVLDDASELNRFFGFLRQHRPGSVPLLTYYLEALKALRAIEYSNAVLRRLESLTDFDFTHDYFQAQPAANLELQAKADTAFEMLTREDLPMFITHTWIRTVTVAIRHRVRGTPGPMSESLAEVFCLTDPSRPDNPIVFMSDEFNRTTQYGVDYVVGRNCRFLQGPHTNPFSVSRIRQKLEAGVEHYETFLNYRRDGSPFMNLVMVSEREEERKGEREGEIERMRDASRPPSRAS